MKRSHAIFLIEREIYKIYPKYNSVNSILAQNILKALEDAGMAPPIVNAKLKYDGWLDMCVAPVNPKREWEEE